MLEDAKNENLIWIVSLLCSNENKKWNCKYMAVMHLDGAENGMNNSLEKRVQRKPYIHNARLYCAARKMWKVTQNE